MIRIMYSENNLTKHKMKKKMNTMYKCQENQQNKLYSTVTYLIAAYLYTKRLIN